MLLSIRSTARYRSSLDCPGLGGAGAVLELMDGALLSDHQDELLVRTKEDRLYRFPEHLGFATQDRQNEVLRAGQLMICAATRSSTTATASGAFWRYATRPGGGSSRITATMG